MSNYYEILGVHQNATSEEIKRAYRKEAMRWHPDREGGDKATFQLLQEAYRWLGDIIKRAEYDKTLKQQKPETKQQQKPPPKKKNQTPVPEKAKKSNISDGKWTPPNPPRYNAWQDCAKPKEPFFTNLRVLIVGVCLAGAGACIVGSFVLLNNSSTTEQATENVKQDVSTEVVVEEKSHLLFTGYNIYGISGEDLESGKVVINKWGIFWFKEAGVNVKDNGFPIKKNLHRLGRPAAIWAAIYADGHKSWYVNGELHNNGPAVVYTDGQKEWYQKGKLHNSSGPAVMGANGNKEWWIDGIKYTEEGFNSYTNNLQQNTKTTESHITKDGVADVSVEDIKSGKVVKNNHGIFYFKEAGGNVYENGRPIVENLHREDGPAAIWQDGYKEWYKNSKRHRLNGPAIVWSNGSEVYYKNGELHREDGPAINYTNGQKEWWINGKQHRTDGPAIVQASGGQVWYNNGKKHREDGPAVIWADGYKEWWLNGILARTGFSSEEVKNDTPSSLIWSINGVIVRINRPEEKWTESNKEQWVNGVYDPYYHYRNKPKQNNNQSPAESTKTYNKTRHGNSE